MSHASDDWNAQLRLADFDRLVTEVRRWVEDAPQWTPLDRVRALWARIAPRLAQLQLELDRVLVVGVVGGTGTGKSTLLNALVGQRVCEAGDAVRPTTCRPVVLAHPEIDASFLSLDDCQPEVHRLASPLLTQMILVDCPDPDTQSRNGSPNGEHSETSLAPSTSNNRNLELLRRVLPHCDVLLCTGTAQKYKTQAVAEELLRHAPGRQVVFVQTHAALDADITADWQQYLQSQGFDVPQTFRLDSEDALRRLDEHRPPSPEFSGLMDFLNTELAGRARHRILRANAIDLLAWFLNEVQREIDNSLPQIAKLDEAVGAQRGRLFEQMKSQLHDQLLASQGIWRTRLLREVTLRWGWGPFAAFLRLLNSARSWLPFLPALRARGLGPMLVAGGVGAGQAVVQRLREAWDSGDVLATADLGLAPGDLAQSSSVLTGFAREAGIEPRDTSDGSALTAARAGWCQRIDAEIGSAIQHRAARRASAAFHGFLELMFLVLPAVLLWRLAKNFFYEHLWLESTQPLLGFDFLLQAALWVLVWGLLLRGLLAWRLQRGLKRDLSAIVQRLTPDDALGPLFDEFAAPAASIRLHVNRISALGAQLDQLRRDLESAGPWQLSRLRS